MRNEGRRSGRDGGRRREVRNEGRRRGSGAEREGVLRK